MEGCRADGVPLLQTGPVWNKPDVDFLSGIRIERAAAYAARFGKTVCPSP